MSDDNDLSGTTLLAGALVKAVECRDWPAVGADVWFRPAYEDGVGPVVHGRAIAPGLVLHRTRSRWYEWHVSELVSGRLVSGALTRRRACALAHRRLAGAGGAAAVLAMAEISRQMGPPCGGMVHV